MRFVIYGAGNRGKRAISYLTDDRIVAFVDREKEKQGGLFCGKPVISLDEYKENYSDLFMIQSVNVDESVAGYLDGCGVCQHSELSRLPGEFAGWGVFDYREAFKARFGGKEKVFLYGINAMTLLAVEYCEKAGIPCVVIPGKDDNNRAKWMTDNTDIPIGGLDQVGDKEEIFVTEERIGGQTGCKNEIDLYDFKPFYGGRYENKAIKKLHHCRKGEKCFIVATGPSLKMEDLNTLTENGIFTFGVNSILKVKDQWLPDAFVCMDTGFQETNVDAIDTYPVKYKFLSDINIEFPWNGKEGVYRLHCIANDYHSLPAFETDLSLQVSFGVTVTFVALQVAAYMGFSEIYLLGVDCNYLKGSQDNHFIKEEKADQKDHHIDGMILNYQSARKYAETHGIKIYNATRGGALEVFERVDFDSLFE